MIDYTIMSNEELEALRAALPKYRNDMDNYQVVQSAMIYNEQIRRYKIHVEKYNQEATTATGLKHGDKIQGYFNGLFGMAGESVTGKIIYDKNGRLAVKYDRADGTGRKTGRLHKGLKKIY